MATLPTLDSLGPRPTPQPQTSVATVQPGAVDAALANVGDAISQIDAHLTEARRSSQLADAMGQATEQLGTKEIEFQRDQDFRTAPSRFKQTAQDIGAQTASTIDDPMARQVFQREYVKLAAAKQLNVVQAAAGQEADYNRAQLSDHLDTWAAAAANASTPFERRVVLDQARTAIGEMRGGNGRPGWITDVQAKQLEDKFQVNFFDAWRVKDPVAALNEFVTNRDKIRPDLAMRLEQHLFLSAAPVLASQLNAAGGAGVVKPEEAPPGAPTMPGNSGVLTRGVRNNNPGNIMRGAVQWEGEVPGNDPRYSSFETPEAGIRAMAKNLIAYNDQHGLSTVSDIVSRWAPATENDTDAYVKAVSKDLGVDPNQPIDVHDQATLGRLTRSMIGVENGAQPYSDAQVDTGVAAALGKGRVAAAPSGAGALTALRDPSIPTGNALIDALPADQKLHVLQLARAQARQDQAGARDELKGRIADTEAAYMSTGAAPTRPADSEILAAYGQVYGPALIRRLNDVQSLGQNIQQVKTLPDRDIENLVTASKPQPGEGYAQRLNDWKVLADAAEHVRDSRRADPVGYAIAAGSYGVKPIQNLSDLEGVQQELQQRSKAVWDIARDYGTTPSLLTKPEAQAISAGLKTAPDTGTQKTILATLFNGVNQDPDLFKKTMRQIAPDVPVLAVAGIYQGRALQTPAIGSGFFSGPGRPAGDVADLILRGNAILHPNKGTDGANHEGGASLIKMPDDKLMLADWTSRTGDAFKGKEQANDIFQQTAKSIYAALSAEQGDYSGNYDAKRWKQSIDFATGGIEKHNGSQIVLPAGWSYDQFRDGLKSRVGALAAQNVPLAASADELSSLPLESVGDGRYIFRRGTGYIVDKSGVPISVSFMGQPPSSAPAVAPPVEIPAASGFAVTKAGAVTGVPRGRGGRHQ